MSDLELRFGAWHGHCNRDIRNEKTFESSEWSKRFSLETKGKKIMKPTTVTNKNARKFPFVDYHYQSATMGSFTGRCAKTSTSKSLRDISRDYFDNEANHDFLSDAAKKRKRRILIISVSAVGLILATIALSRLKPAAPSVDRSSVWIDTVKRGPMVRQVRGL